MLWRVTLAVALLCGGSICGRVGADLMSSLIIPRDYGVKLCGREFIRAVIFTCGGSRWRRSAEFGSLPWTSARDERGSLGSSLDDLLAVYRPDRKKRNFSLGVAGKCCSQGCTKNDIGRLC